MITTELLDDAAMGERLTGWLRARQLENSLTGLADQGLVTVRRLADGHSNRGLLAHAREVCGA
jgi:hypothetical protein